MDPSEFIMLPARSLGTYFACPVCAAAIYEVQGKTSAREKHIEWHRELVISIGLAAGID